MRLKILTFVLALSAITRIFSGCQKEDPRDAIRTFGGADEGIMIYHDFSVQDVVFQDFDTEKYDDEEFKEILTADVEAYNEGHTFTEKPVETDEDGNVVYEPKVKQPIEVVVCEAKDNLLNQQLLYATAADFIVYNEANEGVLTKRGGTVLEAGMIGELDSAVLMSGFINKDGEPVDMEKFMKAKNFQEYRYVHCNIGSTLYVEGAIACYCGGVYSGENNCISVPGGTDVYVIFK